MRVCWSAPVMLLSLCAGCPAQESCPWLTEGTAAALLGGPVAMQAHASAGQGMCSFLRAPGTDSARAGSLTLTIEVSRTTPRECAEGERVVGVGEDATRCSTKFAGGRRELLRGRVRSTWFLLSLTGGGAEASHDKEALWRALEQAGEEVAGNLF